MPEHRADIPVSDEFTATNELAARGRHVRESGAGESGLAPVRKLAALVLLGGASATFYVASQETEYVPRQDVLIDMLEDEQKPAAVTAAQNEGVPSAVPTLEAARPPIELIPVAAPEYMNIKTDTLDLLVATLPTEGVVDADGFRIVSAGKNDFENAYFDNYKDWGLLGTDPDEPRSNLNRQIGIHMHTSGKMNDARFNVLQERETGLQLGDSFSLGNEGSVFSYRVTEILEPTKNQLEGIDIYEKPVGGGVAALILCKLDDNGNRTDKNIVYIGQLEEAHNK